MRFHPPAFAALALAAAVFATPAAALTLEFEFQVDDVLGGPGPVGMGDVFRARATFHDAAATPVVFGDTFQPVVSLELFLDVPERERFSQSVSDVLGWFEDSRGEDDTLRLLGQNSFGDAEWVAWGLPEKPEEEGLSYRAVSLSVVATAPAGFLDGMGPEDIGRLRDMDVSMVLSVMNYMSAWDPRREDYVWKPMSTVDNYRIGADMVGSSVVPLPAAGLLLPAALGGLAFAGRRRARA